MNWDQEFNILILVVDDMVFASNKKSLTLIDLLSVQISNAVQGKLPGALQSFVSWEIKKKSLELPVSHTTENCFMLQLHNLTHVKPLTTPLQIICELISTYDGDIAILPGEHNHYRSLVGSPSLLVICSLT